MTTRTTASSASTNSAASATSTAPAAPDGSAAPAGPANPAARAAPAGPANPAAPASKKGKITYKRTTYISQAGMIAALYAAATLITLVLLQSLAWGPVQFRVSEAVTVVAALTPAAIPGLTVGCVLANLIAIAINGTGMLGLLDVVFGSLATCLGALWCWKMRERPAVALLGPVLANALIVPAYLPLMLQGMGYYTIPFTSIDLDGLYLPMYLFGLVATGAGEAIVMYVLGYPLLKALKRFNVVKPPVMVDENGKKVVAAAPAGGAEAASGAEVPVGAASAKGAAAAVATVATAAGGAEAASAQDEKIVGAAEGGAAAPGATGEVVAAGSTKGAPQ